MLDLLIIGPYYHSLDFETVEYQKQAYIGIKDGIIEFISSTSPKDLNAKSTILLGEDEFLIPGFIDTHIHAPQYVNTGTGYDKSLLEWLNTYTFPKEANFGNLDFARQVYEKVVRKTLAHGTTCASYYGTIHCDASVMLAQICTELGQRAYIGKVNMDRNSPDYYVEDTVESLNETKRFIQGVSAIENDLVTPCITPRFVPSCTPGLMQALGDLAKEFNLPIQSHLSESVNEIAWVKDLHPEIEVYAKVYEKYGLLNERTIMAHCVHSDDQERKVLFDRKVGIAHCASSNFCLHSGMLNVRRLVKEGFTKIGLGTDCSGGYSPSILDSMRQAIIASKVVSINSQGQDEKIESLGFREAFYMATLGGASVLNLDHLIGNFKVGKKFDAVIVNMGKIDLFDHDDHWSLFEKFFYLSDDRNIKSVFVNGNQSL